MINVYPTRVEAVDEDGDLLFVLSAEGEHCCTIHVKKPILLSNQNLEQLLTAVRRAVQMLELKD
jgi:hypothetical protein